jgi:hypothetical protein
VPYLRGLSYFLEIIAIHSFYVESRRKKRMLASLRFDAV